MSAIEAWGGAMVGSRDNQEDWHTILPLGPARVALVVADGMGGHASGEVASQMAGQTFADTLGQAALDAVSDDLVSALSAANVALADAIAENSDLDGMGTTLVGAIVTPNAVSWVSVGDSPLLLARDGSVVRLNADHSLGSHIDSRIREGELSADQAPGPGERYQLVSAVSGEAIEMVEVAENAVRLLPHDVVIAATDGILTLDMPVLARIVQTGCAAALPEVGAAILAAITKRRLSHQDNASVVLARIAPTDAKPTDSKPTDTVRGQAEQALEV